MKALLVLVVAALLCGLSVFFGPQLADALLPLLGAEPSDYPLVETIYTSVIFGSLLLFALVGGALTAVNPLRPGASPGGMLLLGIGLGLSGVAAAVLYTDIAGTLVAGTEAAPGASVLLWGSAVVLLQTTIEEIYFRGWLQPVLSRAWGRWPAILATTLVFAMLHLLGGAETVAAVLNLFLGGLLFGMLADRSKGIAGAVGAHFAWNWLEQIVLGLTPNPGTGSFSALIDYDLSGAAEWGGSSEGLNGSAAMTFALLALVVPLMVFWLHRRLTARKAPGV